MGEFRTESKMKTKTVKIDFMETGTKLKSKFKIIKYRNWNHPIYDELGTDFKLMFVICLFTILEKWLGIFLMLTIIMYYSLIIFFESKETEVYYK